MIKRKYLVLIMLVGLYLPIKVNGLSSDVKDIIINTNGVVIQNSEYKNLLNLGFTDEEIYNMTENEINLNKKLIGHVVTETTKYFKVSSIKDVNNKSISFSVEISENEYNDIDNYSLMGFYPGYIETGYKKETVDIISLGENYRYKNSVEWKEMPSVRSYDVIGIGIDTSVYISSNVYFQQNYCYSSGDCNSSQISFLKSSSTGGSATFTLPTSKSITKINSYIYFSVSKNTSSTLKSITAYGDYAHCTSRSLSSFNSNNYSINKGGINFESPFVGYFDEIPEAEATLTLNW